MFLVFLKKCFYLIRIDFCLWISSEACFSCKGFFSIIGFHINWILWDAGRVEDSTCENVPHKLCFSCSFKMMYLIRTNFWGGVNLAKLAKFRRFCQIKSTPYLRCLTIRSVTSSTNLRSCLQNVIPNKQRFWSIYISTSLDISPPIYKPTKSTYKHV